MKKTLLIPALMLIIAILLVGCNTTPGQPAPDPIGYRYTTYTLDGETFITLTKYVGTETDVVVPTELDGLRVTEIGVNCFAETDIVSVTVPPSITVIESGAFTGCANLTTVNLPEEMLFIGSQAFSECTSLKEITLPASGVTEYSTSLFLGSALEKVTLSEGMDTLPASIFFATNLSEVTLPSTMEVIHPNAFAACSRLTSVKLNEGLRRIEDQAFMVSPALTEIVIPETVEYLTEAAFVGCESLTKVMFEGNATAFKITDSTFTFTGKFTVYYHEGAEGFTTPEWEGFPTKLW